MGLCKYKSCNQSTIVFLGDYKKVIKFSQNNFNTKDLRVNTSALIEFNKKIYVTFKSNWDVIGGWYIKIFSNKNTYLLSPLEQCVATNKNLNQKKFYPKVMIKLIKLVFIYKQFFSKFNKKR